MRRPRVELHRLLEEEEEEAAATQETTICRLDLTVYEDDDRHADVNTDCLGPAQIVVHRTIIRGIPSIQYSSSSTFK
jgi:hypothetical protein